MDSPNLRQRVTIGQVDLYLPEGGVIAVEEIMVETGNHFFNTRKPALKIHCKDKNIEVTFNHKKMRDACRDWLREKFGYHTTFGPVFEDSEQYQKAKENLSHG